MNAQLTEQLDLVVHHLYINPLERCNLRCRMCYTRKTDPVLADADILEFIGRYGTAYPVETVTFCGGEVFTLPGFPALVNRITAQGIIVSVITNGTIDRLDEFDRPNSVNLIVSLDGVAEDHDANRGAGMYVRSTEFLKRGLSLGFHGEIFSIVTRESFGRITAFETGLAAFFGRPMDVTYHPRKPQAYLDLHPESNIAGQTEGFGYCTPEQMETIMATRRTFPPRDLGCFQISLVSDGRVFGCCEGTTPIGRITDDPHELVAALGARLEAWERLSARRGCQGCSQPDFVCGLKQMFI